MKDLNSLLNRLQIEKDAIEKIARFLKTKRGIQFVTKLNTIPLKELCTNLKAPKVLRLYKSDTKNKNLILATIKKYDISIPKTSHSPTGNYTPGKKCQIYLTKEELRKINSLRPRKTLGRAELMHAYEEAKMAKYIRKNPAPTETELKQDLFPKELQEAYDNKIEKHREQVRNFIVSAYYKVPIIGRFKISNGKYVKRVIAEIKDIEGGAHHINEISKHHPLIRKAQQIVDEYYKQDDSLVCIIIKGHNRRLGRILIPHKIMLSTASAN